MDSFRRTLDAYPMPFPETCAFEFCHALVHIAVGIKRNDFPNARKSDLRHATDHVRRAHLDYLKILILRLDSHLRGIENPQPADLEKKLRFRKATISARQKELIEIGERHDASVNAFRAIIQDYRTEDFPGQAADRPEERPLSGRTNPDEPVQAANTANYRLLHDEQGRLLWEWARLESVLNSLRGSRAYDVSYDLLDSYLEYQGMSVSLKEQTAMLKMLIMDEALELDHAGVLREQLNTNAKYTALGPAVQRYKDSSPSSADAPLRVIIANIDDPFHLVEDFLDLAL